MSRIRRSGSAGVIDGSIWKDANGNPVSDVQACDNVKTVYTYNVKNDCMLNIVYNNIGIDRAVEPVVKVNGTEVCRFLMIGARASDKDQVMLPVAAGSVVTLTNDAGTAIFMDANSGTLTFTEFKLRATNVSTSAIEVIAMSSRSDAPSWWRVYADGWCEQGGEYTNLTTGNVTATINLLIPYEQNNYSLALVPSGATSIQTGDYGGVCKTHNVNYFTSPVAGSNGMMWQASGWISDTALTNIKAGKVWNPSANNNEGAWEDPT